MSADNSEKRIQFRKGISGAVVFVPGSRRFWIKRVKSPGDGGAFVVAISTRMRNRVVLPIEWGKESVLYLTSRHLPYPLVDTRFAEQVFVGPQLEQSKSQVGREWICSEPEHALIDLYLRGRKFDAVVMLDSDTVFHRRGSCLHRGSTLGLLPLVMKSSYIHVASPSEVLRSGSSDWRRIVDLPAVREDLEHSSKGWLPGLDLLYSIPEGGLRQWAMTRVSQHCRASMSGIEYHVHWKSIWEDAGQFDVVLLPASFESEYWERIEEVARAPVRVVRDEWNYPGGCADPRAVSRLVDPVEYCRGKGFCRVGVVPSGDEDSWNLLQRFSECGLPIEIHFYHLRRDSCETLYEASTPVVVSTMRQPN